jgi:DNA-binding transcriptional ArsR family regulator
MNTNQIAHIGQLVGEPARTAMLLELLDGRSLTANELARAGSVTAPTASRHLALLVDAGLLQVSRAGRHRYHRLASAQVAQLLESIMQLAARQDPPRRAVVPGPRDKALRRARTCYDHIAGQLGVAIAERLLADGAIAFEGDAGHVTDRCEASLQPLGIEPGAALAPTSQRTHCRPCLDWSERRFHVAGRLGTLICSHCLQRGWLLRRPNSRALEITPGGAVALRDWLGHEGWSSVA